MDIRDSQDEFLQKLIAHIEQNMADEDFGVSELAEKVSMSRSNLLRKIQKASGLSASVFIRKIRLLAGRDALRKGGENVSQVSFQVGFGSPSYFVKCYREEFGYPPGEEKERFLNAEPIGEISPKTENKNWIWYLGALAAAMLTMWIMFFYPESKEPVLEKSIAVLPFKNDSGDSSNVYVVNGLMEAIINNLQNIEDLRIVSRTSTERYRNSDLSIPEIAEELGVSYFIEGSGQKQGNQLMLNVQLIKGVGDDQIWSEQYRREAKDIFALQAEVAKDIAQQVQAKIAPEEIELIETAPTTNLLAYDYYLRGLEAINQENFEGIVKGIEEFKNAIEADDQFAEAYAYIALGYYYDDFFRGRQEHTEKVQSFADQAFALKPNSTLVLSSKGLAAMKSGKYEDAINFFEEVLEENPNSPRAYNYLTEIYLYYIPNARKYLEYALKGMKVDKVVQDSTSQSIAYLHIGNAFIQTGFFKLSEEFIQKSIAMDTNNLFSQYLDAYIKFAQDRDFDLVDQRISAVLAKDTNRIDILQELGKVNYVRQNYDKAVEYYDRMERIKAIIGSNLFETEDVKYAFSLEQIGREQDANFFYDRYKFYAENDQSIYGNLSLAAYYASQNEIDKGMDFLKQFSEAEALSYWFILFIEDDPILSKLAVHPDYESTLQKINDNFWKEHEEIKEELSNAQIIIGP